MGASGCATFAGGPLEGNGAPIAGQPGQRVPARSGARMGHAPAARNFTYVARRTAEISALRNEERWELKAAFLREIDGGVITLFFARQLHHLYALNHPAVSQALVLGQAHLRAGFTR